MSKSFPSWVSSTPLTNTTPIPAINTLGKWAYVNWQIIKDYLDGYYFLQSDIYRHDLQSAPTFHYESMDSWWDWGWDWGGTATHEDWAIKLPCPTWSSVASRKNITNLNLSWKHWFEFQVKADNWANVDQLQINLWNTVFSPNYWRLDLKEKIGADTIENNVWIKFTFSKEDFALMAGSLDWANTEDMMVRAVAETGTTPTVYIKDFRITYQNVGAATNYWRVLFCADDGWKDQDNLLTIAENYGQKVCLFVIPNAIEPETWGAWLYYKQSELDAIHERGHIISLHGGTALTTLTGVALDTEIASIVAYRDTHPEYRGSHMFALPEWKMNAEIEWKITNYFKYIFSIDEQKAYPYDNESTRIPRRSLLNTTATAVVTWLMDSAMDNDGLQIINFHHVITTPVISTDYSIANTDTVFAYASTPTNGIIVWDWITLFPR